jgi:hypothetical protein
MLSNRESVGPPFLFLYGCTAAPSEAALLAKTPKRKPKPNGQHSPNDIPYADAVKEGRALRKERDDAERRTKLRLGELAARVERKTYGDRTLAKFAEEIGVRHCVLERYQSVWKAWDGQGKAAPGPVSFTVLKELQNHPQRKEIVTDNPQITKREAAKLRHQH